MDFSGKISNQFYVTYDSISMPHVFVIEYCKHDFRMIKDGIFQVAFNGAFGNFWSALMKIPQVWQI